MAPPIELSVPTTSVSDTAKPYTQYHITIRQPLRSYTLQKRYSDFTALHSAILEQCGNVQPPAPLPGKNWFKSTVSNPELAEERRKGLEEYLTAINSAEDSQWRSCKAWTTFLKLPEYSSSARLSKAAASATQSSDLLSPIVDPTVWLDIHRDLKSLLHDTRAHLARRDGAETALTQQQASAEAKRCIVRAGTMISALEKGLNSMGESREESRTRDSRKDSYEPPRLGDGEIRRRRDLLSSARKERDMLENTLNNVSLRAAANKATDSAAATQAERTNLIGPGAGKRTNSSRRVLGGPVQETEQTRELDNEGVLQLQKQVLEQQDLDVGDLTTTVRRMKEMGLQINDELEAQKQLLDLFDQDVDRVGDKIAIAKKRVGNIK